MNRVSIRTLSADELAAVYGIDMTEDGDVVYQVIEKRLVAVAEEWHRPPRNTETWDPFIEEWKDMLGGGGAAWGAFYAGSLVGIAVLRARLTEDTDQLAALFVSREYRRTGVARRLVADVVDRARTSGAQALYVSATPSRSAVGFYLSQGFRLADEVNAELFAREPEDIHLVRSLQPSEQRPAQRSERYPKH